MTTQWRVSRGIHDARNRTSLEFSTDLVPGVFYDFTFELIPEDYVFLPGHGIGVSRLLQEEPSCGGLNAFVNEVRAVTGRRLTAAQAGALVADATRISAVLGC